MRYYEIINEFIQNKPKRVGLYINNRIKDLSKLSIDYEKAKSLISQNENEDRLLTSFLRYGTDDSEIANYLYDFMYSGLRKLKRIDDLKSNLESVMQHGIDFIQYILSHHDYDEFILTDEDKKFIGILNSAQSGAIQYGFSADDSDPEYVSAMKLLEGVQLLGSTLLKYEYLWNDMHSKLGTQWDAYSMRGQYRPKHEEVETLYHASAFCPEILADGFLAEKPIERRGLGNYGEQTDISFTHDLEIARNLMRCLKEMWMIAHGQLTVNQIKNWIYSEKLEDDIHAWDNNWKKYYLKDETKEKTVTLYNAWLSFNKIRSNPVFTYPERTMKMLEDVSSIKNIGVLECQVKIMPEDEYFKAEAEFRLPPDRVISIKRKI